MTEREINIAASSYVTKTDIAKLHKEAGYVGVAYESFRAGWDACSRQEGVVVEQLSTPIEFLTADGAWHFTATGPHDARAERIVKVPLSKPAYDVQQAVENHIASIKYTGADWSGDDVRVAFAAGVKWQRENAPGQPTEPTMAQLMDKLNAIGYDISVNHKQAWSDVHRDALVDLISDRFEDRSVFKLNQIIEMLQRMNVRLDDKAERFLEKLANMAIENDKRHDDSASQVAEFWKELADKMDEFAMQLAGEGNLREQNHAELLSLVEAVHGAVTRPLHDVPEPEEIGRDLPFMGGGERGSVQIPDDALSNMGAGNVDEEEGAPLHMRPDIPMVQTPHSVKMETLYMPDPMRDLLVERITELQRKNAELERRMIDMTKIATGAA